jgi:hypothetical protein
MKSPAAELNLQGTHSVRLPPSLVDPFINKGQRRAVVVACFEDRTVRFHAALQKRKGAYWIMFSKGHQKALGIFPNDYFRLHLEEDQTEFGAEMPPELEEVLYQDPEAAHLFRGLSPGACRSVIYAVARYKTPQRRVDLALDICERLKVGMRSGRELVKGPA